MHIHKTCTETHTVFHVCTESSKQDSCIQIWLILNADGGKNITSKITYHTTEDDSFSFFILPSAECVHEQ